MKTSSLIAGLTLSMTIAATLSANTSEATSDPVDLKPYSIITQSDLPKEESWRYAKIDGFEVLSDISNHKAQEILERFQQFRQALDVVYPQPDSSKSVATLILSSKSKNFDSFTPDELRNESGIVSHLLQDADQSAIVLDLNTNTLLMNELVTKGTALWRFKEMGIKPHRQLYREYIKYSLPNRKGTQPAWFIEGITQVLMDIKFNSRYISWGKIDKGISTDPSRSYKPLNNLNHYPGRFPRISNYGSNSSYGTGGWGRGINLNTQSNIRGVRLLQPYTGIVNDSPFHIILSSGALMPFEEFLSVTANDTEALNPIKHMGWSKQAYAFVHMCHFGRKGQFKKPLETFVSRLNKEPLSEPLFEECFGMNYKKMQKALTAYVRRPYSHYHTVKLTEDSKLTKEKVEFRRATQSEIARIKGDAQRLAGHSEIALQTFRNASRRGVNDREFMAAMGAAELEHGNTEKARNILEAVAIMDTERPSAWTALARLRLNDAIANPEQEGKLSASQMNKVLAPVLKTLILKPAIPETYHLIAEAWEHSAVEINSVYVNLLGEGAIQFPHDSELTLRVANHYANYGDEQNAAVFARLGLEYAKDDALRTHFRALIRSLPPLPSSFDTASQ